ncbi:hypothetical protein P3X46_016745 [Hevea brasiliensis]|uniref:Protein kinase domain-containing protein n=1 Tax=Hevea brasiliensis TaxID=3981 RepID=A0ABQ9M036_HEVBR|nr:hypothetical protein P3X46_016745 [Hevea brasiliensis]
MEVARSQSFAETPHAQPLPLPGVHHAGVGRSSSGIGVSRRPGLGRGSEPLDLPLPRPGCVSNRLDHAYIEGDIATASVSSVSSTDSDYPSDSRVLMPLTFDYEHGNRTATNSPSRRVSVSAFEDQSPIVIQKNSKEVLKPADFSLNNHIPSTSPRWALLSTHVQNSQMPYRGAFCSVPDCSRSNLSRSPIRTIVTWKAEGLDGSTGIGQLFWPSSRCSRECSPVPSPRMTSPRPSSSIQTGGTNTESPTSQPDDGKQQSHQFSLPPITISNTRPFSPAYSTATSPSVPRSPNKAENPASPGSRWKKGRLPGRGTFGHVYLRFNCESGEMCAMKEVTLFADDPKSKESAKQLVQEIALLSRLRHPNIVHYYGFEMEFGQFGEMAIRNYTQQILDIKGANILVDPSGRVKLANLGMITGLSCPLSFKGSHYWMAPEVLKMATTKPPWSQYEGGIAHARNVAGFEQEGVTIQVSFNLEAQIQVQD